MANQPILARLLASGASHVTRHAAWSFLTIALALDCSAGEATRDWQEALAVIQRVALDRAESDEHRATALAAYAKLLISTGQHDEALALCRKVLQAPEKVDVASAALRAGGLVERNRCGHLRSELGFVDAWSRGANAQAALAVAQDLSRGAAHLSLLAAKAMVPGPVALKFPHWAEAGPGRAPSALAIAGVFVRAPSWYPPKGKAPDALRVSLPQFAPPHWRARLTFPALKEATQ